jgi:hypothetical protein
MGVDEYRDREGDAEERTGLGQGERVGEGEQDVDAADRGYRDTEGDARSARGWAAIPRASTPASATPPPRAATPPAADQSLLHDRSPDTTVVA